MSVARVDGRVIGVACALPPTHGARRRCSATASFSVHATTDPVRAWARDLVGLESKHEEEAEDTGCGGRARFASAPTAPLFLGPLGWTEVGQIACLGPAVSAQATPARAVRAIQRFAFEGDAAVLAEPHRARRRVSELALPRLAARLCRLSRGRGLRRAGSQARTAARPIALVADLVGPAPAAAARVHRRSEAGNARLSRSLRPSTAAAYASCGFLPTPMSLHFMGKPLAGELDPDPRAWRFTLGDTDFF